MIFHMLILMANANINVRLPFSIGIRKILNVGIISKVLMFQQKLINLIIK